MRKTVIGGAYWIVGSNLGQMVLRLLNLIVLARLLTPQDFGIFAAAYLVIGFLDIISQIGIGPSLVQIPELRTEHVGTGFTITMAIAVIVTPLLWFGAAVFAEFLGIPEIRDVIRVTAFIVPIRSASVISENLLRRDLRYRPISLVTFFSFLIGQVGVGITLALMHQGYWALVWANLSFVALKSGLFYWLQPHRVILTYEREASRELLRLSGGFTLSRVFNYLALRGDYLVVGKLLGPTSLGFYNRAYRLLDSVNILIGRAINTIMFPIFARVQKDTARAALGIRIGVEVLAVAFLPASVFGAVHSRDLVFVILGEEWIDVAAPFRILALGMFFKVAYKFLATFLRGHGLVYRAAGLQFLYAAMVIGGAAVMSPFGIAAVAMAVLLALSTAYVLLTLVVNRELHVGLGRFLSWHGRGLVLGLTTLVALLGVSSLLGADPSELLRLSAGGVTMGVLTLTAWSVAPRRVFGEHVVDLVRDAVDPIRR